MQGRMVLWRLLLPRCRFPLREARVRKWQGTAYRRRVLSKVPLFFFVVVDTHTPSFTYLFFGEVTKNRVDHFLFWGFSIYGCAFPLEMFNKLLGYEWRTFSGVLVFTRRAINAFFLLNRRSSPSLLLSRELGSVACPSNTARDRKTFTWAAVSQSLYKREKRHFAGSTRWVGQLCISDVSVERMV